LHTIKGLAAMVNVEPIVDLAHAMEAVLREADRASGQLPEGSVELLLTGVRTIDQRVQALAKRQPVGPVPPGLLAALSALHQSGTTRSASERTTSLPPELWARLDGAEREELIQGLSAGRRACLVRFLPAPERS